MVVSWVDCLLGASAIMNSCILVCAQVLFASFRAATPNQQSANSNVDRQVLVSACACAFPVPSRTPRSVWGAGWAFVMGSGLHTFSCFTAPDYISHRPLRSGLLSLGLHFPKAAGATRNSAFLPLLFVIVGVAVSCELWLGKSQCAIAGEILQTRTKPTG